MCKLCANLEKWRKNSKSSQILNSWMKSSPGKLGIPHSFPNDITPDSVCGAQVKRPPESPWNEIDIAINTPSRKFSNWRANFQMIKVQIKLPDMHHDRLFVVTWDEINNKNSFIFHYSVFTLTFFRSSCTEHARFHGAFIREWTIAKVDVNNRNNGFQ